VKGGLRDEGNEGMRIFRVNVGEGKEEGGELKGSLRDNVGGGMRGFRDSMLENINLVSNESERSDTTPGDRELDSANLQEDDISEKSDVADQRENIGLRRTGSRGQEEEMSAEEQEEEMRLSGQEGERRLAGREGEMRFMGREGEMRLTGQENELGLPQEANMRPPQDSELRLYRKRQRDIKREREREIEMGQEQEQEQLIVEVRTEKELPGEVSNGEVEAQREGVMESKAVEAKVMGLDSDWLRYEGEFYNGKKHGLGALFLRDGSRFTGMFKNDMIHGIGSFYFPDGRMVTAEWENNKLLNEL